MTGRRQENKQLHGSFGTENGTRQFEEKKKCLRRSCGQSIARRPGHFGLGGMKISFNEAEIMTSSHRFFDSFVGKPGQSSSYTSLGFYGWRLCRSWPIILDQMICKTISLAPGLRKFIGVESRTDCQECIELDFYFRNLHNVLALRLHQFSTSSNIWN